MTGDADRPKPYLHRDVACSCKECGYAGPAEPKAPGETWLEMLFWAAFLLPGVLYSAWRLVGRFYVCPACRSRVQVRIPPGRLALIGLRLMLMVSMVAALVLLGLVWGADAG